MKISKKSVIKLQEKIPVYDIEVDHECHNFCLDLDGKGIYVHNCGKTEIEITLAINQAKIFGRQLIIVPTISIKEQMIKRAEMYNIKIVDYRDVTEALEKGSLLEEVPDLVIGVPNSILNDVNNKVHKELLSSFRCLIVDEAHHSKCDTWSNLFLSLPNVYRIHGFSALPVTERTRNATSFIEIEEKDGINISVCGDVIYKKTSKDLKDFMNIPLLINFKYDWKNYDQKILKSIDWNYVYSYLMCNEDRNKQLMNIIELLNEFEYNTVSYVNRKAQGVNILQESESSFNLCWFSGEYWMRNSDLFHKEKVIKFSDKKYTQDMLREEFGKTKRTIIMSSHGIEGLDFSNPLNALVYSEGKSERQGIQKVGRIVRPGNKKSVVVNFWDTNQSILTNQAKIRKSNIVEEFDCETIDVYSLSQLRDVLNKLNDLI